MFFSIFTLLLFRCVSRLSFLLCARTSSFLSRFIYLFLFRFSFFFFFFFRFLRFASRTKLVVNIENAVKLRDFICTKHHVYPDSTSFTCVRVCTVHCGRWSDTIKRIIFITGRPTTACQVEKCICILNTFRWAVLWMPFQCSILSFITFKLRTHYLFI